MPPKKKKNINKGSVSGATTTTTKKKKSATYPAIFSTATPIVALGPRQRKKNVPSIRERKLYSLAKRNIPHLLQPGDVACVFDALDVARECTLPPLVYIKSVTRTQVLVEIRGGGSRINRNPRKTLRRLSDKDKERYNGIAVMQKSKERTKAIQVFVLDLKTTECEGDKERFEALIDAEEIE